MRLFVLFITLIFSASIGAVFFVLEWDEIKITKKPESQAVEPIIRPMSDAIITPVMATTTAAAEPQDVEAIIEQAENLIVETQEFIRKEKEIKMKIEQAKEKSARVRGIYAGAAYNRAYFKDLLEETILDSIVIDVKEASYGVNLPPSLKGFIEELRQEDIWTIARVVVFRDNTLLEEKPGWYLMATRSDSGQATSSPWRDGAKAYWLDPQNQEVHDYIIEFSKKVIDLGFDELQFDYIRYPDDYYATSTDKQKIIGNFFSKISESLKSYKPDIILSVDLFGYVATQFNSYGTGQRLIDAGKYFDYLSFMLYPSHFYGGFNAEGIYYTYPEVVEHPYDVVHYSIISAKEYLSLFGLETKIRPWLQDFDLAVDSGRGVFYDADKILAQINAAESASSATWLLWNPSYIYTLDALK